MPRISTDTPKPVSPLAFGIASVLSDIKRERRLTQGEMADSSGLTQPQVSRFITASARMSVEDLVAICDGLGLDPAEFLATSRQRAGEYELRTSVADSTSPEDETP